MFHPLAYRVGGLLYMPPFQDNLCRNLSQHKIPYLTSLCFCLEDAIQETALPLAEQALFERLEELSRLPHAGVPLPLIFIRVRSASHLGTLLPKLTPWNPLITGYIFPKFSSETAFSYFSLVREEEAKGNPLSFFPVLETADIARASTRAETLRYLKKLLDGVSSHVIGIRVGGNDFSQLYGLRCPPDATIYTFPLLKQIFGDIISTFGTDYAVSAPVRNYFSGPGWEAVYLQELHEDAAMGFLGKTCIHPRQLPLVAQSLAVKASDLTEAREILAFTDKRLGVSKSLDGGMREPSCQRQWAQHILTRSHLYGQRGNVYAQQSHA